MTTYYYAKCDQFEDCRTGWHVTPEGAIESFWTENHYSDAEAKRINVYTREVVDPTAAEWAEQAALAESLGLICVTRPELAMYAK